MTRSDIYKIKHRFSRNGSDGSAALTPSECLKLWKERRDVFISDSQIERAIWDKKSGNSNLRHVSFKIHNDSELFDIISEIK